MSTVFKLKGGLFTLTILELYDLHLATFETQLEETLKKAPKFFQRAPIVVDLNKTDFSDKTTGLNDILASLRSHGLIPVGIRGGNETVKVQAEQAGLASLHNSNHTDPLNIEQTKLKPDQAALQTNNSSDANNTMAKSIFNLSKIITQPVRSGQQIYAKNSDLIVLAPVSHGAEILADGNIHVYGPLRGRALAGIMENVNARIFCKSLEAELISIAGHYLVNEQLDEYRNLNDLHVFLQDDLLKITQL